MIENCGQCPHLVGLVSMGLPIYGCGKTRRKLTVPQDTRRNLKHPGRIVTVFDRVPAEFCPLPNDKANKKEAPPYEKVLARAAR